jgi:hypothetical protein
MHSKAAIATRECPAIVLVAILIFAAEPEMYRHGGWTKNFCWTKFWKA